MPLLIQRRGSSKTYEHFSAKAAGQARQIMKFKLNSYFAVLLVTIIGSGAAFIVVHIGTTDVIATTFGGSEADYAALQQSILRNK